MATMKKAQNGTREKVSTVSNLKPAKAIPFNHNNQFSRKTLNSPLPSSASILRKKAGAKNGKTLKKGGTVKKAFLGNLLGGAGGGGLLGGLLGGGGGGMLGGLLGGGGGKGGAEGGGMGKISKMFGGSMKKGGKVAKKAKSGTSVKKAQSGDSIKKPSVRMTSTKNYDVKETTYPGGDKETTTKFNPRGGAKFNIPPITKKKAKSGASVKKCRYGCK
jgi:hypothetical protein